ncbi:MAG: KpsF/GutQ family sugar-phosphate isomerase [Phycisphaerae bacterium]|nr:KpsF/GutQ family sugar-phosphate isomerase [Phycisphaerae bacterium]
MAKKPKKAARPNLAYARKVIRAETDAVAGLVKKIDADFSKAARMVYDCAGTVVTSGIGKAGIIAQKLSATLASTGTPSHFLHAAEAVHGDLGRVQKQDIVVILSYGGETDEVKRLLEQLKKMGVPIIAVTGRNDSTLARRADVVLWLGEIQEACPLGLAPSATTTAMLALGDALALTVLEMRDFGREDFALFHPGGSLGRQLLKVEEVMRKGEDLPIARDNLKLKDVLVSQTKMRRRSGATLLVGKQKKLTGIFTDADLRRLLEANGAEVLEMSISKLMTRRPKSICVGSLASEAMHIINQYHIDELPVVDAGGRAVGLIDVQDLLAVGLA